MQCDMEQIKDFINKILEKLKLDEKMKIAAFWEEQIPNAGIHSRPIGLKGSKLKVIVDSPVWMQHLTFSKRDIIQKINTFLGKEIVKDIRFIVGDINEER